jgi:hypothetical protein
MTMLSLIFAVALSSASQQHHLGQLHLIHGQPYLQARMTLLQKGWKPLRSSGDRGTVSEVLRAGWKEVSNCQGTGLAFCTFDWKRGAKCARLITQGEYLPERGSPKVWDAEVGSCREILAD